ncbi:MAG: leucine-rich repeat protein [Kiritimatiellae bacterium]|nr:leucine-rich repeat protein [Kiritimatiellia bacterium]
MRSIIAKLAAVVVAAAAMCFGARAETEEIDGITWTYEVNNGEATITGIKPEDYNDRYDVAVPSSVGDGITVTAVGDSVGQFNSYIKSLPIPDSVKSIGNYSFYYCYNMEALAIGKGLQSFGYRALYSSSSLTTLTVDAANTAFSADGNVLYNKAKTKIALLPESFTSFEIPASVTELDDDLRLRFRNFVSLTVDEASATFSAEDNFLYDKAKTILYVAPNSFSGTYNAPSTLKEIKSSVFSSCDGLTGVVLPAGFETIGESAFNGCRSLASAELGGTKDIQRYAFQYCNSLEAIVIPNTTTNIGGMAFFECSSLIDVTIGSGVAKIGDTGHLEWNELDEGYFMTDAEPAFGGCSSLMDFKVASGNETYQEIGGCIFLRNTPNDAKTLAVYPAGRADLYFQEDDDVTFYSVTKIDDGACAFCYNFTELYITNSVREIGVQSFVNDSALSKLVIPAGPTNICYGAFQMNLELMDVEIAGTVKRIGEQAFVHDYMPGDIWDNPRLGRLLLHEGIEEIVESAFEFCPYLGKIVIPDSVTTLGESAFAYEQSCPEIVIGSGVETIPEVAFSGCGDCLRITIGENVTSIGDYAFEGCENLKELVIPEGVTSVGENAFYGCYSLKSLTLPDSLVTIGSGAFYECNELRKLVVPPNVTSIGEGAFASAYSLERIYLPASLKPETDEETNAFLASVFTDCSFEEMEPEDLANILTWYSGSLEGVTVTFVNENGETPSVEVLDFIDHLPVPFASGFAFAGWWTASDDSGEQVTEEFRFTEDTTLYAHWASTTLTFGGDAPWVAVYDYNYGEQVLKSGEIFAGETSTASQTVTGPCVVSFVYMRQGYDDEDFLRVYVDNALAAEYGSYADWEEEALEIVEAGTHTVTWSFEKTGRLEDAQVRLADVTVEAAVPHTVTFNTQGGTMSEATTRTVLKSVGKLPRARKDGAVFAGWWTTADESGVRIADCYEIEGDATFYAHWIDSGFTSGGDKDWLLDVDGSFKSERLVYGEQIYAEVRFTGPCRVSFDWKSGTSYWSNNAFEFFIDDERQDGLQMSSGGSSNWYSETYDVEGEGEHVFRWVFDYDDEYSGSSAPNCVWLKNVSVGQVSSITFDENYEGGDVSNERCSGTLGELPLPTRNYFLFLGWFTQAEGGEQVTSSTPVTGEATYYAHWKAAPYIFENEWVEDVDGSFRTMVSKSYTTYSASKEVQGPCTVSFKWKAATAYGDQSVYISDRTDGTSNYLLSTNTPAEGWNEQELTISDGSSHTIEFRLYTGIFSNSSHYIAIKDFTVMPLASYTVTFNENYVGGSATTRKIVQTNPVIGEPPSISRSGYAVDGWWTAPTGGERISAATVVSADTTFYAHWVECPFAFAGKPWVKGPDGEWRTAKMDSYASDYGATMTVEGPCVVTFDWKKDVGYSGRYMQLELDGSYNCWCDSTDWETKTVKFAESGSHTVYWRAYVNNLNSETTENNCFMVRNIAVAELVPCVVTFNANYTGGENTTSNYVAGDALGELPVLAREGYMFVGWFTAATGGDMVTAATPVMATMTVYAQWKKVVEVPIATFDSTDGDADWFVETDGSWCSGDIDHNQSTWVQVTVTGPCDVSFKWNTSSESSYDFLTLYVDGVQNDRISGTSSDWIEKSVAITASGSHVLKWTYSKDSSASSGDDCGWVKDLVVLQPAPDETEAPPVAIDDTKMETPVIDEETGVRTIAAKDDVTLTQADVESVTIASPTDPSADITAAYTKTLDPVNNQIVVTLATPAIEEVAEEENKDPEDATGLLEDISTMTEEEKVEKIAEMPTPDTSKNEDVGALPVKMYPGLYYQAAWGSDLNSLTSGEKFRADGTKTHIGVIKQTGSSGFYRISVSEK